MKKEILVTMDTNILRDDPYFQKADMDTFIKICNKGKIQLSISEIVVKEYKSQQLEEICKKFDEITQRLETKKDKTKNIDENKLLKITIDEIISAKNNYIGSIEKRFSAFVEKTNSIISPISENHGKKVMDDYFEGKPPFKTIKNRKDIPDSFIYHFINDQIIKNDFSKYCFITNDQELYNCVEADKKANVYHGIEEFVSENFIQKHIDEINIKMKEDVKQFVRDNIEKHQNQLHELLNKELEKELPYKEIIDESIKDDNCTGHISMHYGSDNMDFNYNTINFINDEMMTLDFSCEVEAGLEYYIFKQDYYCLDFEEQKRISISDHNKHYFEAEEVVQLSLSGKIAIKLDDYSEIEDITKTLDNYELFLDNIESIYINNEGI